MLPAALAHSALVILVAMLALWLLSLALHNASTDRTHMSAFIPLPPRA